MSTKIQAKPLFAATLTPHRSLSPRGKRVVIGLVAALALVPGIVFYVAGAWPVVGFMGLDVIAIWVALTVSMRGLDPYLAACGLFATAYLLSVGFAVPHIGAALFLGAATAGTLLGSAVYDHVGAFGNETQETTLLRAGGIGVILLGVVMVRLAP